MKKSVLKIITVLAFIFTTIGIGALFLFPPSWSERKEEPEVHPRIVIPHGMPSAPGETLDPLDYIAPEDNMIAWAPLNEGEVLVSVLSGYFGGYTETQFVAYRNLWEIESPIYLAFINYDEESNSYRRVWRAATAAARPGTARLYTQDLLGDRSVCVLLSGMNNIGEHTLTAFRMNPPGSGEESLFTKIVDIRIDGNIVVREVQRTQSYLAGQSRGQSFTISSFGRDFQSSNILDQLEIIYAFNEVSGLYEQSGMNRIPGLQVEQQRVRELLGSRQAFETFLSGLWYRVTPQGSIDRSQYIYYNPVTREIVFHGDETQQVFNWLNSTATRLGLQINSQNISINSLRRTIDIELETLESIRMRIVENIRLIRVNSPWDGTYRKAGPVPTHETPVHLKAHIAARYDGPTGRFHFNEDGTYELTTPDSIIRGYYAFVMINEHETLELRPYGNSQRETYLVISEADVSPRRAMSIHQARIGTRGVVPLNELALSLTLIGE